MASSNPSTPGIPSTPVTPTTTEVAVMPVNASQLPKDEHKCFCCIWWLLAGIVVGVVAMLVFKGKKQG